MTNDHEVSGILRDQGETLVFNAYISSISDRNKRVLYVM